MISPERAAEIEDVIHRVTRWARTQSWGPITEHRFATTTGLEVEIAVGPPDWANINPIDPGTRRVVTDGARVLHDPTEILATLLRACRI
ncbi:MAG: hypothetical protein GEU98_28580 [Pseudonocardiaceae bacterium]|nr:hypothetical protein [Pseudonocardiaceae bacterium]